MRAGVNDPGLVLHLLALPRPVAVAAAPVSSTGMCPQLKDMLLLDTEASATTTL